MNQHVSSGLRAAHEKVGRWLTYPITGTIFTDKQKREIEGRYPEFNGITATYFSAVPESLAGMVGYFYVATHNDADIAIVLLTAYALGEGLSRLMITGGDHLLEKREKVGRSGTLIMELAEAGKNYAKRRLQKKVA